LLGVLDGYGSRERAAQEKERTVRIGLSLLLIAIGAILKFAVTTHVNGLNLATVGVVLIVVGAIGLVLSLIWLAVRRRTDVIHEGTPTVYPGDPAGRPVRQRSRTTYYEPNDPGEY
jgi:hypothetical protein